MNSKFDPDLKRYYSACIKALYFYGAPRDTVTRSLISLAVIIYSVP